VPFEAMPFLLNPPEGLVATANSRPDSASSQAFLGLDFLDDYRRRRICELLSDRSDWDVGSTARLQLDEMDITWREVREAVLVATPETEEASLALDLLGKWDGVADVDSSAATLFHLFVREMWQRAARARAPKSAEYVLGRGFTPLVSFTTFAGGRSSRILRLLREQPEGWFERGWPAEISDALTGAISELRSRFGREPAAWAWGRVRPLVLDHPLGRLRLLAPVFNRGPFAWGGNGNTISQAGGSPLLPLVRPLVIASARMVVEVGDWNNARFVLPGGQSGNPLSPHYDDLLPLWLKGEGAPIAWTAEALETATVETLTLRPA